MPMKNDTMGSLRFDEKTNYPVQYLNSAENSRAIVDIFLSALDAYIKMNGVDGDPDDAIRFARSIVRATLNNDPKELMVFTRNVAPVLNGSTSDFFTAFGIIGRHHRVI